MIPRLATLRGLIVCLSVAGCGPKVHVADRAYFDEDDPAAADGEPPAEWPVAEPTPREPVRTREGTVRRKALLEVLGEGPPAFFAGVELEAHFRDNRFAGWRIVRFWPGDPRFAEVDLRPGDVVASVNEQSVMKPEQFYAVWETLRAAPSIEVRGTREGEPFTLRFQVLDAPAPPIP